MGVENGVENGVDQKHRVVFLHPDEIEPHPKQPRKRFRNLERLGNSIDQRGQLQPIGVVSSPAGAPRPYRLIWGERRWRAAQLAGGRGRLLLAFVRDDLDEEGQFIAMGEENLNRENWNPIERAKYLSRLESDGLTDGQAAALFDRSPCWVSNNKRLLKLPGEFQQFVIEGKLHETTARYLLDKKYSFSPANLAEIAKDIKKNPEAWEPRTRTRAECLERAQRVAAGIDPDPLHDVCEWSKAISKKKLCGLLRIHRNTLPSRLTTIKVPGKYRHRKAGPRSRLIEVAIEDFAASLQKQLRRL
jgi:ParB/RepB/Spo0J family partition protein